MSSKPEHPLQLVRKRRELVGKSDERTCQRARAGHNAALCEARMRGGQL